MRSGSRAALVMWPLDDAEGGSRAASSNTCARAALLFCIGLGRGGWAAALGATRSTPTWLPADRTFSLQPGDKLYLPISSQNVAIIGDQRAAHPEYLFDNSGLHLLHTARHWDIIDAALQSWYARSGTQKSMFTCTLRPPWWCGSR